MCGKTKNQLYLEKQSTAPDPHGGLAQSYRSQKWLQPSFLQLIPKTYNSELCCSCTLSSLRRYSRVLHPE